MAQEREPQTFLDWVLSNEGSTAEVGIRSIVTDKMKEATSAQREALSSILLRQMVDGFAHKLYLGGFVPHRINLGKERDACLGAMEVYATVEGRFEGEFPNYMALCFEMWSSSYHVQRMNPLQFTHYWARGLVRRARWHMREWWFDR